uniref:FAD dependent oxidoreductase domain-containing protein n=1 Tax=Dendroctonus ponderosae TaxID=77166 RepID=J3JYT6_DENPD|nr:unknown [Dendroctonus ponderosae]
MLFGKVGVLTARGFLIKKSFSRSTKLFKYEKKMENPFYRTGRVLLNDVVNFYDKLTNPKPRRIVKGVPVHADIIIIGGGAIGSSIAYWLKEKTNPNSFEVLVIDKDLTFKNSATALSVGGLRQQFSLPENIQMSLFGAEFIRTLKDRFGPSADVCFTPHGYLMLASEEGAEQLIDNSKLQNELGAVNIVLSREQLKNRFPWINVDDVAVGCLGLEKEGWFDPWPLLQLLKKGAEEKAVQYINGEVVDFLFEKREDLVIEGIHETTLEQSNTLVVKMPNGEHKFIEFALCIIAAGADSGKVAELIKIGTGEGILSLRLPVEPRKRYVYTFDCAKDPPGLNTPMTIDHTGAYFRRDGLGGRFICGISPDSSEEPETTNLEVNYDFFHEKLWPVLAHRVPAFNAIKVKGGWSGFYEYNTFDENGIVGPHPYYTNIYLATGFSGHGIQQAPAIWRGVAEMILDGKFQTIDLTRLGFDRFILDKPLMEAQII